MSKHILPPKPPKSKWPNLLIVNCYARSRRTEFLDSLRLEDACSIEPNSGCDRLLLGLTEREKRIAGLFFKAGAVYALDFCEGGGAVSGKYL